MRLLRHLSAGRCSLAAAAAAAATAVIGLTAQQSHAFVPHPSRQPLPRGKRCQFSSSTPRPLRCGTFTASARAEEWREAVLPFLPPDHCRTASPAESLGRGEWFKLICGASFEASLRSTDPTGLSDSLVTLLWTESVRNIRNAVRISDTGAI